MRWINTKKDELIGLQCINPINDKHILRLSPNSKNMEKRELDDSDIRIISIIVKNKPTLFDIKNHLLSLQKEYDSSAEVNRFMLNNKEVWLDKLTRAVLFNTINLEKSKGVDVTTLWFNTMPIKVNVDKALTLLTAVEMYAKKCYDNTQKHYVEINKLETIEDCLAYDITKDYPDILNIQIE